MYNNVTVQGVLPKRIHLNLRLPPFISRISATNNNSSRKSPQKLLFPYMIILYVCFVCIMSLQKWFPGQSWRSEKTQTTFKRKTESRWKLSPVSRNQSYSIYRGWVDRALCDFSPSYRCRVGGLLTPFRTETSQWGLNYEYVQSCSVFM